MSQTQQTPTHDTSNTSDQNTAPTISPTDDIDTSLSQIKQIVSKQFNTMESKQELHTSNKTKLQLQLEEIQKQLQLEEEHETKCAIQIQSRSTTTFYEILEILVPYMQKYPYLLELYIHFSQYIITMLFKKQDAVQVR